MISPPSRIPASSRAFRKPGRPCRFPRWASLQQRASPKVICAIRGARPSPPHRDRRNEHHTQQRPHSGEPQTAGGSQNLSASDDIRRLAPATLGKWPAITSVHAAGTGPDGGRPAWPHAVPIHPGRPNGLEPRTPTRRKRWPGRRNSPAERCGHRRAGAGRAPGRSSTADTASRLGIMLALLIRPVRCLRRAGTIPRLISTQLTSTVVLKEDPVPANPLVLRNLFIRTGVGSTTAAGRGGRFGHLGNSQGLGQSVPPPPLLQRRQRGRRMPTRPLPALRWEAALLRPPRIYGRGDPAECLYPHESVAVPSP